MSTSSEKRLLEAARRCDGATIEEIVSGGKSNLDAVDQIGCTALHLCAKSADLLSLALLLEKGAKTDIHDNSGMCPLHHAASKDYVETMALLISYGADINKQDKDNNMTPLHYAAKFKHDRATEFLLFCGADFKLKNKAGDEAIPVMSEARQVEHRFIQDGFAKGHIQLSGKMLRPHTEYHFPSLGLTIVNNDSSKRNMCFFCRRILLEYARSTIRDGEEVISDVFQYLVNQPSDNVIITIPGYSVPGQFDEAFIKDNVGYEYSYSGCRTDSKGIYYTATIALSADDDNQGYFMVVTRTKEERFIATGKPQTMRSSVEPGFMLELPDRCLPNNTPVVFKILPTCNHVSPHTAQDIRSASNFCEIDLSTRQRRPLKISLPLPPGTASESDVIVCHAEENQTTETTWNMIDCQRDPNGGNQVTITERTVGRGSMIVLELPKTRKDGFLQRIKQFVSWLYNVVRKRIKPCVFSALTKSSDGVIFRVLVILTEEKDLDKFIEKWEEEKFQTEKSQTSSTVMVKPNDTFLLRLEGAQLKIQGERMFRISFQSERLTKHEFLVVSKEFEFGRLLIYKLKADKVVELRKIQSEKCLVQLNIELRMKTETDEVRPSFTEFPDSKFLCDLASKVGDEWFLLGVCLGLSSSYLETIQRQNTPSRTNQTLLYSWRADSDLLPDVGLSTLLHALSKTGRYDLIAMVNKELTKIMKQNPQERVALWAKQLVSGLDDVDAGLDVSDSVADFNLLITEETVPSPSSDLFLVQVSQIIGPCFDIIPMLGIGNDKLESMKQGVSPETVMLKCLIQCRRKHGDDHIKFLDELLEALTVTKNNLAVSEIMKLFNQWLKSSASDRGDSNREATNINAFCAKFKEI